MKKCPLLGVLTLLTLLLSAVSVHSTEEIPSLVKQFYTNTMNATPYLPADLSEQSLECRSLRQTSDKGYLNAEQANYADSNWGARVNHQTTYFKATEQDGRITIIDFATRADRSLGYKYFSNANSHNQVYEPWSSSKIFAYTGAIATIRKLSKSSNRSLGANSKVGDVSISDLITSINSYSPTNNAPDDSNAIATYFANIAGRDYLT